MLRIIDEIEQMVETASGFMGKRMVNEEEFFVKIQMLRSALPAEMKRAETVIGQAPKVNEVIAQTRLLTSQEQLQIIAALERRLADESQ